MRIQTRQRYSANISYAGLVFYITTTYHVTCRRKCWLALGNSRLQYITLWKNNPVHHVLSLVQLAAEVSSAVCVYQKLQLVVTWCCASCFLIQVFLSSSVRSNNYVIKIYLFLGSPTSVILILFLMSDDRETRGPAISLVRE